jgi:hypothetical protein
LKKVLVALLALVAIVSLAGNVFLYQRYSTSRPVMRIGSDAVTLKEYRDSLEHQFGQPVLTKLAVTKMVTTSAAAAGVSPAAKDVETRLADIERREPKQLEAARQSPEKMAELKRDLTADMALENLTIKDVKLSESQVRAFYNQNKARFQVPVQTQALVILARNSVDAATAQELLKMKKMTPATIASTQPRLGVAGVNLNLNWDALPTPARARLASVVQSTPMGGVRIIPIDPKTFFVIRVDKRAEQEVLPFEKVRSQAERMARLAKAPSRDVMLARLYKDANVQFEIPRYASFFKEFDSAAAREPAAVASSGAK